MHLLDTIINQLFWMVFFVMLFYPYFKSHSLEAARWKHIRKIEQARGSRVITLIHRQETKSLFGFFSMRFLDIEDSEAVLRAIRMTPENMPIDIIIHTPGGVALAASQIANALADHKANVRVIVPHYAMSGGTLIALSADEIVMDKHAVLGPVDPQLGSEPAASLVKIKELKDIKDIKDETLVKIDIGEKALTQMKETVVNILTKKGYSEQDSLRIAQELSSGRWTHDFPITVQHANQLGLKVSTNVENDVYALMDLYPQPTATQSVKYIPIPYTRPGSSRSFDLPNSN